MNALILISKLLKQIYNWLKLKQKNIVPETKTLKNYSLTKIEVNHLQLGKGD